MSTWGKGLWDNDKSVDAVGGMIRVMPSKDLWHLLACWGLRLWFGQCEPKEFARGIERKAKDVVKLPKPVFNALSEIAQRPDAFKAHRSRKPEHSALIGDSSGGYRMEPLFELPEVRAVTETVAERCAARLDSAFKKKHSLPQDALPELGVLLELTNVRLYQDAARVEKWKTGFAAMNARTTEERPFWDEYVARVEKLFPLLVAP